MPAASLPAPAGLGTLPDDLLLYILGRLSTMERFSAAALVCTCWHQLCHAPQLLRSLDVDINSNAKPNPQRCFPRVQLLQRFLASHGQHVRSLRLNAANPHPYLHWNPAAESFDGPAAAMEERQALAACLQCCTQLEELTVGDGTLPMGVGTEQAADWLLAMPRLRRLNHLGDSQLRLPAGLSGLTLLEHANLEGEGIRLRSLPLSLTSLQLLDMYGDELPEQLMSLTRLQRLDVNYYDYIDICEGSVSFTRLQQLSLLTHLSFFECGLPATSCLARLPHLRQLAISSGVGAEPEDRERLEASLAGCQQCPQLTLLALSLTHYEHMADPDSVDCMLRIPRSVAQLRNLRAFVFDLDCFSSVSIDPSLPEGSWLHSLRWLALPWSLMMQQAGVLAAAAPTLQRIFLSAAHMPGEPSDRHFGIPYAQSLPAFERFVLNHHSLEFVGYAAESRTLGSVPPALAQTLLHLASRRPALLMVGTHPPAVWPTDCPAFLNEPHLFGPRY